MKKLLALFHQSLFIRLMAIFFMSVVLFIFIMSAAITFIYKDQAKEWSGFDFFEHHINFVIDDFGTPPDINRVKALTEKIPVAIIIKDQQGRFIYQDQNIDPARIEQKRELKDNVFALSHGRTKGMQINRNGYQYLLFGRQSFADRHDRIIGLLTTSVVLFVLLINYLLVRHLLRPIKMLTVGAERISQGELNYRVPHKHSDELGILTCSINNMADTLNGMLEAKRQLLLAISHELRTPITRAKIQLEMMPADSARNNLLEDINELDMLVADLLEAERLNSQHAGLHSDTFDIVELTESLLQQFWADNALLNWQAPSNSVPSNSVPSKIPLDKLRYQLLLRNLISNALKYGDEKTVNIRLAHNSDSQEVLLTVSDQGQGIAAEHLTHITEPFYRTDNARQRQTGGFGLGLYLCRLIAEAHGGSLNVDSIVGEGTTITVRLPSLSASQQNQP